VFVEADRLGGQPAGLSEFPDPHEGRVGVDLPLRWNVYGRVVSPTSERSALITVLSVPDCPNVSLLVDRLEETLPGGRQRAEVFLVRNEDEASAWGMCGSPTLLLDGVDPFATDDARPSLSCRLYRGPDGQLSGVPSVEQLRKATTAQTAGPGGSTSWLDPVGRGGQGRLAPTGGGMRAVQQAVLRAVAASGEMPDDRALDAAAGTGRSGRAVLAALAEQDFLYPDDSGVHAAYPFSLRPTRHRVAIEGGPTVWAMCAIDALGIAPMLGRATTITSSDPISGRTITVSATPTAARWEPSNAVVFVGRRNANGPAAAVRCDTINFFASAHTAARWAALRQEVRGAALDQADAVELGRSIFGRLLEAEPAPGR
jgi:alkylmercury lyase-like protein